MSMLTVREADALQRAGKLGRFIRTHKCPECHGAGLEGYGMIVDLCPHCGGSGRLAVYANTPKHAHIADEERETR